MATVKLRYSSPKNITFRGDLDTGIERAEWDEMSDKERDQIIEETVWNELIEISLVEGP